MPLSVNDDLFGRNTKFVLELELDHGQGLFSIPRFVLEACRSLIGQIDVMNLTEFTLVVSIAAIRIHTLASVELAVLAKLSAHLGTKELWWFYEVII